MNYDKAIILIMFLFLVPSVFAGPKIFTLSKSSDSVTYPQNITIFIHFEDPNGGKLEQFWKGIIGGIKTFKEVSVDYSINGNAIFDTGEKRMSRDYGEVTEAKSDSLEISVTEEASCLGDNVILTATVSYKIYTEEKTEIPNQPESDTITFEARYCQSEKYRIQFEQCSADLDEMNDKVKEKEKDLVNLKTEKDKEIGIIRAEKINLESKLQECSDKVEELNTSLPIQGNAVIETEGSSSNYLGYLFVGFIGILIGMTIKKGNGKKKNDEQIGG